MPYAEIKQAIQDGDTIKLSLENLESIEKYLPSPDEVNISFTFNSLDLITQTILVFIYRKKLSSITLEIPKC